MASAGDLQQADVLLREYKVKESLQSEALHLYEKAKEASALAKKEEDKAAEALADSKSEAVAALKQLQDFVSGL